MTALEVIAEFMIPIDDNLNVLLLGDHQNPEFNNDLHTVFNYARTFYGKEPNITKHEFTLSNIFNGTANHLMGQNSILIFDPAISSDLINIFADNDQHLDSLDKMLLDKFIDTWILNRLVLDVSTIDDNILFDFLNYLDQRPIEFNYLMQDTLLGIWINCDNEFNPL